MRINHNISALNTYRQLSSNSTQTNKALEKLSSGLRINRAADDAAGLAISEKMRGQIRGLTQASSNAQDSISLIQTAEGALNETHSILQRMRELAVQASNDTVTDSDRAELQKEVAQLKSEVDRIATTTEFNTKKLLNGSLSAAKLAQGSIEASNKFDVADLLGTNGSITGGANATTSEAKSGQSGTGSSYTAGGTIADKTVIQTGVNDRFNIQINGNAYEATIAASSSTGYSKQEFVDALNAAVKNAVNTDWSNENNQAVFTLGADGRLSVTTASKGSFAADTITFSTANYDDNDNAIAAVAAGADDFTLSYKGLTTAAIAPDAVAAGDSAATAVADLQSKIDAALTTAATAAGTTYTAGTVKVGYDKAGHITFTDTNGTGTLAVASGTGTFTPSDKIEKTNVKVYGPAVPNQSAASAMGFDEKATTINGSRDLSAGIAVDADNSVFNITIGHGSAGAPVTIDLTADASAATKLTVGQNATLGQVKDALQSALDNKLGKGSVTVSATDGRLILTNNVASKTFQLSEVTPGATTGVETLFDTSGTVTSTPVLQGNNVITGGKDTMNAVKAGTVISKDVNDQFTISVDGNAAKTLTLTAGTYATAKDLIAEINNQINSDKDLVGKVKAQLDNDGKVQFVSTSTGVNSSVVVDDPAVKAQSALGAFGYSGFASQLTQTAGSAVDIKNGLDLATNAKDRKFDVTLGNKTVTIDLSFEEGVNTDASLTNKLTSGDAIVRAVQNQLNKAFGDNAITVSTVETDKGEQNLVLTSNTRASALKITNGSSDGGVTPNTGANALFGAAQTGPAGAVSALDSVSASVSATIATVSKTGTDAVDRTLDTTTKLVDMTDVDGNKLGLTAGNVIHITGTQNGKAFSTSVTVTDESTVSDMMNALRDLKEFEGATVALDAETGKFIVNGAAGAGKDISNLKFTAQKSATDTTDVAAFNTLFGKFNGTQQAQNASSDKSLTMQIGANHGQTLQVDINDMGTEALRIQNVDVSTAGNAQTAISVVDNAIVTLSSERAKLGAYQNRLEHTINNLGTSAENLTSSESRIRDVDMAKEMMEFTKNNILSQAAQTMLAQANQQPQGVLQLLRG